MAVNQNCDINPGVLRHGTIKHLTILYYFLTQRIWLPRPRLWLPGRWLGLGSRLGLGLAGRLVGLGARLGLGWRLGVGPRMGLGVALGR